VISHFHKSLRRFIMGPNDVDLARVFVRELREKSVVGEESIDIKSGLQIVVEAEAGTAIHGQGTQFLTNIVVRDLTANNNIPAQPAAGFSGQMDKPEWQPLDKQFVFTVAPGVLAGRQNHLCEVLAFLKAGIKNPDVEFATSYTFILTD
jgi:hypothetical protein